MKPTWTVLVIVASLAAVVRAQQDQRWNGLSKDEIAAVLPEAEALYLDLHRNPELSLQERRTSALLAERLRTLGYDVKTGMGGYGVVAILRNGAGPSVLLRTDTDALPVEEKKCVFC
jgi:metal-dependent amidase/aminoacylase/carboxypeptidase family protein